MKLVDKKNKKLTVEEKFPTEKDTIGKTSQFDKDKHLKKIQSASSILLFFILINFVFIVYFGSKMGFSGLNLLILLLGSAINIFMCVVFMQAFTSIKEYLSYISDRMDS